MEERILEEYDRNPVKKAVAKKLGFDERTVKRVVKRRRTMSKGSIPSPTTTSTATTSGLEEERLKTIYREFEEGKKPYAIIAAHGYDPDFVETQYNRFLRLKDCDPVAFQEEILEFYQAKRKSALEKYDDSFRKNGCISANDMTDLLEKIAVQRADTMLKFMFKTENKGPPEGWCKLKCEKCGRVYTIKRMFGKTDEVLISGGVVSFLLCEQCSAKAFM